ncbi:hypothetical protein KIF53_01105 [Chromobacterium subtsugae]|uniref:Bacteriocin n=1 Tax=Chromobacterium subtsugae TaxID=251747 RepID=A0ABS7F817_9NEIS|nr:MULTISPECIES: hypothetical protein [Chromobacterium]MBW7565239.1 hypothetical protein [Chromobacterium subtsugae]MBW8286233.1 hypothetical protein [Chromobacterium subtsugae]WSE91715.1 hypothetical protein U6115_00325 [Chromobacterium subtsugae]WVH60090.1 hypothetical protein U6151_00325 [Chromobacterium subtsugae]
MTKENQVAQLEKEQDIKDFLGIQVLTPAEEISVSGGGQHQEKQQEQQHVD